MPLSPRDVEMTFFRAKGPGGQHRNKTASAVRLRHKATGVTVEATEERCQHKNREVAFRRLEERLRSLRDEAMARAKQASHRSKPSAGFGSSRRTYRMIGPIGVSDSSTGHFETDIQAILNGRIDGFLRAGLLSGSGQPTPDASSR